MSPKDCASPSPSGRRWPEGPDEGRSIALTRRFAAPSPRGRATSRPVCCDMKQILVTLLACLFASFAFGADERLLDAVRKGDRDAVRELLCNHSDVNASQPYGSTPLLLAADRN